MSKGMHMHESVIVQCIKAIALHMVYIDGCANSYAEHFGEQGDSFITLVPGTERMPFAQHMNSRPPGIGLEEMHSDCKYVKSGARSINVPVDYVLHSTLQEMGNYEDACRVETIDDYGYGTCASCVDGVVLPVASSSLHLSPTSEEVQYQDESLKLKYTPSCASVVQTGAGGDDLRTLLAYFQHYTLVDKLTSSDADSESTRLEPT